MKPNIIIYSNYLLKPSATFIKAQAEALQNFTPYYVGSRQVSGLPLPENRTLVVNTGGVLGKAKEVLYKTSGVAPTLLEDIQKVNPVLIHAHFAHTSIRVLRLARYLGIPLVVTFHGIDATLKNEYIIRHFSVQTWPYLLQKNVLKREARKFIAVSEFIQEKLVEQSFPIDKLVQHYIGIDTEKFRPNNKVLREPIVLFVGRLVEKKGCEYLISAMQKIQEIQPAVELVIIGDGDPSFRSHLEQMAGRLLKKYRFLGFQPPKTVKMWMNKARVFSVPSITAKSGDSEGFGMVFAEAQAMGLPVVSFASGGISEAVANGKTGFLVTEGDWKALAIYILKLLQEETLWQEFSEQGKNRVNTLFDLHNQTAILEQIYESVL